MVETTCPWGNHIRVHAPDPQRFGPLRRRHAVCRIRCAGGHQIWTGSRGSTREILGGIAGVANDERGPYAWANTSADSKVTYRETDKKLPPDTTGIISRSRLPTSRGRTRSWSSGA